jgi:anthranilate synthase component 1
MKRVTVTMVSPLDVEKLAGKMERPCLIPLVLTLKGCASPANLYFSLKARYGPSYLLESIEGPGEAARYSVIGCDPLLYLKIRGMELSVKGREDFIALAEENVEKARKGDALEILKGAMLKEEMHIPALATRYMLSCVGYIGYDYVRSLVDVGHHATDDLREPELEFMLPGRILVFDHLAQLTHYCSLVFFSEGGSEQAIAQAREDLNELMKAREAHPPSKPVSRTSLTSNLGKAEFESHVKRAQRYIRAGDIIQVVLSRRLRLDPSPPLERFYLNLRRINPSPYMFFLDFPERSVVGSSPEILVKVEGKNVVTRPIAGTRRRGKTPAEDKRMEQDLLADEKERAEHVMLVDLGRNDIGRVAEFNSVKVTEFMRIEKYSHVQHMVTNVVGRMRRDKDAFDALRATFPAGTVTGAPKVRAMEIIEELEPTRRGIYAGALGSFSYTGDADLAIIIRTLISEGGKGYVQVGAGIVTDSVPWKEHYETENKARALLRAAGV